MPDTDEKAYWKPLEARLPVEECAAFMYMGNEDGLYLYKHIDSRRYLCLDEQGNCFAEDGVTGRYAPADFAAEYRHATDADGLEKYYADKERHEALLEPDQKRDYFAETLDEATQQPASALSMDRER
jgi:hypothetical protein